MEEANRNRCMSISFPSISTGIFRYPVELAAPIALRTVARLLYQPTSVTMARFVLFDEATHRAYLQTAAELPRLFPGVAVVAEAIP
jgi:O-acetyl-ADP-ribose deacetylase (regulator of RNase III)